MYLSGTMELVAMELKQSGYFLARTLSYEASLLLLCRPATSFPTELCTPTCSCETLTGKDWALVRQIRDLCHT